MANRCWLSVTRVNHGCFVQRPELVPNRLENMLVRSTPEIGPADALVKERVAREQLAGSFWQVKADASRTVTRCEEHFTRKSAETKLIAFTNEVVNFRRLRAGYSKPGGLNGEFGVEIKVLFMK